MALVSYLDQLGSHPGLLKQSACWRLDHILDTSVSDDVKEQWIYEIKEIIETLTPTVEVKETVE